MADRPKERLDGVTVDSELRSIIRQQSRAHRMSQGSYLRLVFEQRRDYEKQLRNVLMLARRETRRPGSTPDAMDHMIRFCREVGVVPSILRDQSHLSTKE